MACLRDDDDDVEFAPGGGRGSTCSRISPRRAGALPFCWVHGAWLSMAPHWLEGLGINVSECIELARNGGVVMQSDGTVEGLWHWYRMAIRKGRVMFGCRIRWQDAIARGILKYWLAASPKGWSRCSLLFRTRASFKPTGQQSSTCSQLNLGSAFRVPTQCPSRAWTFSRYTGLRLCDCRSGRYLSIQGASACVRPMTKDAPPPLGHDMDKLNMYLPSRLRLGWVVRDEHGCDSPGLV
jgi:hypothetical protein